MANITPELNKISTAVYGEEVRSSIVEAIRKINTALEDADVTALQEALEELSQQEATDISMLQGVIDSLSSRETSDISAVQSTISSLSNTVSGHTSDISDLSNQAHSLESEIDSISEFLSSLSSHSILKKDAIPDGVNSCNDLLDDGIYFISAREGSVELSNYAFESAGWLFVITTKTGIVVQIAIGYNYPLLVSIRRKASSGDFTEWTDNITNYRGNLVSGEDLNDVKTQGIYLITGSHDHAPATTFAGWLRVVRATSGVTGQYLTHVNDGAEYYRAYMLGENPGWTKWANTTGTFINHVVLEDGTDLNSVREDGFWLLDGAATYTHKPDSIPNGSAGWLITFTSRNSIVGQFVARFSNGVISYRKYQTNTGWSEWVSAGGGGGSGSGDVYNNTYEITTSPTITTDTNGWLTPVDTESSSESGKTDMTGAIMSMLTSTGYCKLAPGIFYVSGNIDMPEGSTLEGCGKDTIIRLLNSVSSGYVVRVGRKNTVKDLRISGSYDTIPVSSGEIGTRSGIYYIANKDGEEQELPTVLPNVLYNLWIDNFSGSGIYCHNTGGATNEAITVDNCYIQNCIAGINVDYYSEYGKFSNVITRACYYACINNGGNNVFTGCTFQGSIGFLMDNSAGDKRNNSHGSCVGCSFNHESLYGVLAQGQTNGFVFSGCHFWYSPVKISASRGMAFNGCYFGGDTPRIEVSGSFGAFFANCIFHQSPNISADYNTKFNACYLDSNGNVVSN